MSGFTALKKRVAVFTGSRAEYGLLRHLIKNINEDRRLELQLIVSGSHLSKLYGKTIDEVEMDGFVPAAVVPLSLDCIPQPSMAILASEALLGISHALQELKPRTLIVLGDRYETFAAAASAHLLGIPVTHIHGGESTFGAIDDRLRHAITQLSTLHFTAAEPYRKRVIDMGQSPEFVFNVGPMVLDGISASSAATRSSFEKKVGFRFGEKNLLVTFHSVTLLADNGLAEFDALLAALVSTSCHVLFTHPNADKGSCQLIHRMQKFVNQYSLRSWVFPSLGQENYLAALQLFEAVAGNSSSGIIEAPLVGIPVLNIGERQAGRHRHGFVLDVPGELDTIRSGLDEVLRLGQRQNWPRPLPMIQASPAVRIVESLCASVIV